jgi:hypothetical protein
VPKDLHCHAWMNIESHEQGRAGHPSRMNVDLPHARLGARIGKAASEVRWFDGPAARGGEHKPRLMPGTPRGLRFTSWAQVMDELEKRLSGSAQTG